MNAIEKLKPKYFTKTHQEVIDLLGEEMCQKLHKIIGGVYFNISPITTYLKNKHILDLINNSHLSFEEIAKKVNCSKTSVYNLKKSCNPIN